MKKSFLTALASAALMVAGPAGAQGVEVRGAVPIIDWNTGEPVQTFGVEAIALPGVPGSPPVLGAEVSELVEELKANNRLQCPTDLAGLTGGYDLFSYVLTREVAADLNVFVSTELSASDRVVLFHVVYYKDLLDDAGDIYARCGAGLMLALKVSGLEGNLNANLGFLAANAELNMARVELRMRTIGLSGPDIIAQIPRVVRVTKFDAEGFASISARIDAIAAAVANGGEGVTVTPQPIAVSFAVSVPEAMDEGLARVHAIRKISELRTCTQAQDSLPDDTDPLRREVKTIYDTVTGKCSRWSKPKNEHKERADALLSRYGVD